MYHCSIYMYVCMYTYIYLFTYIYKYTFSYIYMNKNEGLKDIDDTQRLQLYGLYKQSTIGDVNCDRPNVLDFVGTAKW
jgi:hypothetical protein